VKFPLSKYNNFKKGKTALDQLVKENSANVEIRYLRYVFQNELPSFLNYNNNIQEDYLVIVKGIEKSDLNKQFKQKILKNMLLVKSISKDQTTQIKLLLNKI
jgi:ubiquinone/menaquinone biosynthesis C-methylase UbiE